MPSRGPYAMQIVTGAGPDDAVTATSAIIPVMAKTSHTTTSNLSFAWTGDPNPTGPDPGARRCSLRSPIFSRTDSPCPYMRSTRSPFSRRTAPWGTRLSRCNTPRPATQLSKRSSSAQRERIACADHSRCAEFTLKQKDASCLVCRGRAATNRLLFNIETLQ